jgi:radical SAM protein with 4Fe4S-binding SPASM domain
MEAPHVIGLLDDLARAGTMFLVLSGGEVFLRRDLFQILERARRLGFLVRLFTDGYFVDERNADRLAALHVPEVHVSLYSTRADAFDRVTQVPGSLARVMRGIERLRARGIKVTVKCPVLRDTAGDALDVLAWARSQGCDVRFDTGVIPQRDGCVDPVVQHTLDAEALRETVDRLTAARGEKIDPWVPGSRDEWPLCGAGRSTVHIDPAGQVSPCVILPMPAGTVRERPFREIWRASPVLRQVRGFRHKDRKGCRGCMNMGFCNFCMGRAYLSTGDPLSPAGILCHQAQARADLHRGRTSPAAGSAKPPASVGRASEQLVQIRLPSRVLAAARAPAA